MGSTPFTFTPLHIPTVEAPQYRAASQSGPATGSRIAGSSRVEDYASIDHVQPVCRAAPRCRSGEGGNTVRTGLFAAIHVVGRSKQFEPTLREDATNRAKR
jgi:hypothetical protein